MGFRKGAYATVWSVEPVSDTLTKAQISVSRKDKNTGEYVTDFSGFVAFIGTATSKYGAQLKERDRIRLGDVDVTTVYDKERNRTYTNYKIFSFEVPDENGQAPIQRKPEPDEMIVDDGADIEAQLPF